MTHSTIITKNYLWGLTFSFNKCWCSNSQGTLSWCKTYAMNLKCQCCPGFYSLSWWAPDIRHRTRDKINRSQHLPKNQYCIHKIRSFLYPLEFFELSSIMWWICNAILVESVYQGFHPHLRHLRHDSKWSEDIRF